MTDLKQAFEKRNEIQFLDVREPYEWEAGHIEGAVFIPLGELMSGGEQGKLDTEKRVIAVCRSGNRSELATLMLQARGYQAENMDGGMQAWEAEGLPFVASDGSRGQVA
jgi:rhodanese-related sulfurtransferase